MGVVESWVPLYTRLESPLTKEAYISRHVPNDISRTAEAHDVELELLIDLQWMTCPNPACAKPVVRVFTCYTDTQQAGITEDAQWWYAYPRNGKSRTAPPEVPDSVRRDYDEAAAIRGLSAKASAALSRRVLEDILEAHGYAGKRLSERLEAFASDPRTSVDLADSARYLVQIGNFGAHTQKDIVTGEILEVEPGEAEWCLELLDGLFEFFFVRPARMEAKKRAFDEKLARTPKSPIR